MGETVSVRLPAEALEGLADLAAATGQAKSDLLREVVQRGLRAKQLDLEVEAYRARRASLGRAAELAHVPLVTFMEELKRQGILLNYDAAELQADLRRDV